MYKNLWVSYCFLFVDKSFTKLNRAYWHSHVPGKGQNNAKTFRKLVHLIPLFSTHNAELKWTQTDLIRFVAVTAAQSENLPRNVMILKNINQVKTWKVWIGTSVFVREESYPNN